MKPETLGQKYDVGKKVPVKCIMNDTLKELDIKKDCFLLLIVREGNAYFKVGNSFFEAVAPCFVCFDEREQPELIRKKRLKCDCVYFHPTFLNVNMSFNLVHAGSYESIALSHDLFLLKPFTDTERYTYPIFEENIDTINQLSGLLEEELRVQSDWYWSCRSRSYFMEIILMLERAYGLIDKNASKDSARKIESENLKKAVIYIESHYSENISLQTISRCAQINHTTLTKLFKSELNETPIEYLWEYRISVAKKHLEFTNLPLKEISALCGFKTTQHFNRKFKEITGATPADFRESAVSKRKKLFKKTVSTKRASDNKGEEKCGM